MYYKVHYKTTHGFPAWIVVQTFNKALTLSTDMTARTWIQSDSVRIEEVNPDMEVN